MKDHEKRELVSRITAVALEYRDAEQLRERIGGAVLPAIDAAVAAERVQIAARIREAWHQREASHGNRAGEYHEGMLAGLDAAVALALGPNARLSGGPLGPSA